MSLFDAGLCGKQHKNIRALEVESTSVLTALLHKLPSSLVIFFPHKSSSKNNSCKDEF